MAKAAPLLQASGVAAGCDADNVDVNTNEASTSGLEHASHAAATPSAGKKRDLDSGSDSDVVGTVDSEALAIVPVTPNDDHGGDGVRRSAKEHKKAKPYYETPSASLPAPKAKRASRLAF